MFPLYRVQKTFQSIHMNSGFSLVEILITLAVLGVLTAFTIPSLFNTPNSSLSSKQTAMAKDTVYMIFAAYEQYRAANPTVTTGTTLGLLTPYMNYVSPKTSGNLDDHVGVNTTYTCGSNVTCYQMHNGGTFFWRNGMSFAGTATTNGIYFFFDPDSIQTGGTADGPGKALCVLIYYDGTIRTRGTSKANSTNSYGPGLNPGAYDPSWFTGF